MCINFYVNYFHFEFFLNALILHVSYVTTFDWQPDQ